MAIINPDGLLFGERLGRCSDLAQFYWPRIFSVANGWARLEIDPQRIIAKVCASLKTKLNDEELVEILTEYQTNYLLFLYSFGGQLWGKFVCPDKYLKKRKTTADEESPGEPVAAFKEWMAEYEKQRGASKPESVSRLRALVISETSPKDFGNISEKFQHGIGVGVGVGDGVGIGKNKTLSKDKPSTDVRRKDFIEDLQKYWQSRNPEDLPFQPSPKDFRNLDIFLKDHPKIERAKFRQLLNSRARAPNTIHSEDIHRWINRILEYEHKGKSNHGKAEQRNREIEDSAAEARRMRGLPARGVEVLRDAARSVPPGNGRGDAGEVSGRTIEGSIQAPSGGPKRLQIPAEARGSDKADSESG